MSKFKEAAHFTIIWVAAFAWGFGNCFYAIMALLILLAKKVHPQARYGNCWTYAIPLWLKYGGHLAIRAADDNKFLWVFPVPHVKYIAEMPRKGVVLRHYIPPPEKRRKTEVWPWYVIYYEGNVHIVDTPHDATEGWRDAAKHTPDLS